MIKAVATRVGALPAGAMSTIASAGPLTAANMNADLLSAQYAVRGELVTRAMAHADALRAGAKRPFRKLTYCNIGNPHDLSQPPITYFRQVLSLINWPALVQPSAAAQLSGLFPSDTIARAQRYLRNIPGGLGAYSHSQGIEAVRTEVAAFLRKRDNGVPAHASDLFLTDGASPAAQSLLRAIIRHKSDGVMVGVPQYPLYSASLALYGGTMVNVHLNEKRGWSLEPDELERSYAEAQRAGVCVRALVVINPGNPTGSVLSEENMRDVVSFAQRHSLVLIADEVYQENVWDPAKRFVSFKAVAAHMGAIDPEKSDVLREGGLQLVSLHSVSKGFTGECGRRGGYFELVGFDAGVRAELYKLASVSLCANTTGQITLGLQVLPPVPGEESYALYATERDAILASLKRRSEKLSNALRALEGVTCEASEGALYAFPRIRIPRRAIAAATAAGKVPDAFYCLALLDATGVVVVPGSGFGQEDGTWHFRSTILPPEEDTDEFLAALSSFHREFMAQYRD